MRYARSILKFRYGPVMLTFLCLVICSGCAGQKSLFYWGGYDDSLYAHYVKNEHEESLESVKAIIAQAEKDKLRVAPGIYAEYGFLLYQQGQPDMAVRYFNLEAQSYPESAPLMQQLVKRIEMKPGDKGKGGGATEKGGDASQDAKPSAGGDQ